MVKHKYADNYMSGGLINVGINDVLPLKAARRCAIANIYHSFIHIRLIKSLTCCKPNNKKKAHWHKI